MNPQRDYESGDKAAVRAFCTLFRKCEDLFQFPIDGRNSKSEEVSANIMLTDREHNNKTTIVVIAINNESRYTTLRETIQEMGLDILDEHHTPAGEHNESKQDVMEGEYSEHQLTAGVPSNLRADWDVPHLIVYGSLMPELEEAFQGAFGEKYNWADIRNHFLVYGENVDADTRSEVATAVQRSNSIGGERQRDVVSDINTASLI